MTIPLPPLLAAPTGKLVIKDNQALIASNNCSSIQLSVIIPTYNECANIKRLIAQISDQLDAILPHAYELIVVDDDSPDQTWKIAQKLMVSFPQLKVMRRTEEKGLSTAVIRGWQVAKGEILGVIDGDLQHPPETLIKLWLEITKGADLAIASRHVEGGGVSEWSFRRRLLSRGAQTLGLLILPGVVGRVSDPMSGFFLIRRRCLLNCVLSPLGYKILLEVVGKGKVSQIGEVGYIFQERQEGDSKVTHQHYIDYILHLLRLRFTLWPVKRFLRFGVVGFSGVFVDLGVFYILREMAQLALTRSAILSAEVAILNNFLWNDLWTFRDLSGKQKGVRQRLKRFLKFNLICLGGLILNVLLINLLFNVFGVNEYLSKLIAIAAVTLWNFWLNLKLSWRVTDVE
jgi:dolichol-phosphate mannosyltransferase